MSNIAEGFGRSGNREFIRFLTYAHGSILELETQLIVAHDVDFIDSNRFQHLTEQCRAIKGLLCGLISYLRKHENAFDRQ